MPSSASTSNGKPLQRTRAGGAEAGRIGDDRDPQAVASGERRMNTRRRRRKLAVAAKSLAMPSTSVWDGEQRIAQSRDDARHGHQDHRDNAGCELAQIFG